MLDLVDRALLLARTPLFRNLPEEALLDLAEAAAVVTASAGERLDATALYVVARGRARAGGVEAGAGHVLGERGVLGAPIEVVAVEDALLLRLGRDDVLDALVDHPLLAARLCELLAPRAAG